MEQHCCSLEQEGAMDSSDKSDGTKPVFKSLAQDKALYQLANLSNRDSDKNQQADLANHTFPVKAITNCQRFSKSGKPSVCH